MTTDTADARPGFLLHQPTEDQLLRRLLPRPLRHQLLRFAVVGVGSTVAYGLLYLMLRVVLDAFAANALALLLTAVVNTAANRRLTFGVRGAGRLAGDHAVGLLAFGAGLALTTGSLAALHASGQAGRGVEVLVLTVANAMATLLRFVALRRRIHTDPHRSRVSRQHPGQILQRRATGVGAVGRAQAGTGAAGQP